MKLIISILISFLIMGCGTINKQLDTPKSKVNSQWFTKVIFSKSDKLEFMADGKKKNYYLIGSTTNDLYSISRKNGRKSYFGRYFINKKGDIAILIKHIIYSPPIFLNRVSPNKYQGYLDEMKLTLTVQRKTVVAKNESIIKSNNTNIKASYGANASYLVAAGASSMGNIYGTIAIGRYGHNRSKALSYIRKECKKAGLEYPDHKNLAINKCTNAAIAKYNTY